MGAGLLARVRPSNPIRYLGLIRRVFGIQMSSAEIAAIAAAITAKEDCRLLVFGLGNDAPLWRRLNSGGRTVFLEDDSFWIAGAIRRQPDLEIAQVTYRTRLPDWETLINQAERLHLELPSAVVDERWDVILIDAPKGHKPRHPGRMQPIANASRLVDKNGLVFVHDCHRIVEREYSRCYLGEPLLSVGRLRGFLPRA